MVVCACAEGKQACLHSNSCKRMRILGTHPFSKIKLPSRIIEVSDNGEGRIIEVLLYICMLCTCHALGMRNCIGVATFG